MDDREEFEAVRQGHRAALGGDDALHEASIDVYRRADEHGYSYVWDWLGLPIIQSPVDIVVLQEVVWRTRPQLVIETGVARGGSVALFASLLELLGEGRVLGVDIEIRAGNRAALDEHPLRHRIDLLEGSSTAPSTLEEVTQRAKAVERVMVVLDSDHTHAHVREELDAYAPLVSPGQYLVVADTIVEHLPRQVHRPRAWGPGDNPATALDAFLAADDRFEVDVDIDAKLLLSSSPRGYLRRRADRS